MPDYHIVHSRPDNAVHAFRDFVVESLDRMIAIQHDHQAAAKRIKDHARISGRIEQIVAIRELFKALNIVRD